jgi:hypothetical protein
MKTEKKRGRGRPKKATQPQTSVTTTKTKEYYDIATNEIVKEEITELVKEEPNFPKDFTIVIDNETPNGEVRFSKEGDSSLAQSFLANAYLDNPEFREFINDIVVRAARTKANRISVELNSIVN